MSRTTVTQDFGADYFTVTTRNADGTLRHMRVPTETKWKLMFDAFYDAEYFKEYDAFKKPEKHVGDFFD